MENVECPRYQSFQKIPTGENRPGFLFVEICLNSRGLLCPVLALTGVSLLNFLNRLNDNRKISIEPTIDTASKLTGSIGRLMLAVGADIPPESFDVRIEVIARHREDRLNDFGKVNDQSTLILPGQSAVAVTVAVDALLAHFALHGFPVFD